jgi:hypothetical protein
VEKTCWKKRDNLEVKVKKLEGDVLVVNQSTDNFTFQVGTSQALLTHTSQHEWVVDFGHTHHMAKYASMFSYLDKRKLCRLIFSLKMLNVLTIS